VTNKKDYGCIYGLIDPSNRKIFYIGKTKDIRIRLLSHKYAAKNKNLRISSKINTIIKKYGKLSYCILAKPKLKNLNTLEKKYITIYRKRLKKSLLNSRVGGEGWQLHFKRKPNLTTKWRTSIQKPVIIYDIKLNKEIYCASIVEANKKLKYKAYTILTSKLKSLGYYIVYNRFVCRRANLPFKIPKRVFKQFVQKTLDNKVIKVYNHYTELHKAGFSSSAVIAVCNKRPHRKTYKGFKWEKI